MSGQVFQRRSSDRNKRRWANVTVTGNDFFLSLGNFLLFGALLTGRRTIEAGTDPPAGFMRFLGRADVAQCFKGGNGLDDLGDRVPEVQLVLAPCTNSPEPRVEPFGNLHLFRDGLCAFVLASHEKAHPESIEIFAEV